MGFLDDIYKTITGGVGSVADIVKGINAAYAKIAGSSAGTASNSAAGFLDYSGSSSGGERTSVDLDRLTVDKANQTPQEVGTTVNEGTSFKFNGFGSFLNPYYLVRYHSINTTTASRNENPNYINNLGVAEGSIEYKGLADAEQYKNPSTSLIISHFDASQTKVATSRSPEKIYRYADFLYLKHYHPFNNNRLITLRRFMAPVYDQLRIAINPAKPSIRRPIAQALSYLDTSGNSFKTLSKMNVSIATKLTKGALDNVTTLSDVESSLGAKDNSAAQIGNKLLSILSGNENNDVGFKNWTATYDPWKNGPLQDLVYGPVNVITGSLIRDRGLTFKQDGLKINFEYSSKSIEHINQKAAMLDILSNMLALTYNHALFWGGENRFLIDRANFPLVRAEVMFGLLNHLDNPQAQFDIIQNALGLASSNLTAGISNIFEEAQTAFKKTLGDQTKAKEEYEQLSADGKKQADNKNELLRAAQQAALGGSDTLKKLQRQILEGTKAELTGAPTGEWHLQVGNPFAPMMMIGNLWCTSADFEFNDELSIDDFPTELKVSCNLKHGRDRDASDIQSIFNGGGGRIYYPYANAAMDVNESYNTGNSTGAFTVKPTETLGAFNRISYDGSGNKLTDQVKLKLHKKESAKSIERALFRPISQAKAKN